MDKSARGRAELASFHAFISCYLREINPGVWLSRSERQEIAQALGNDWSGPDSLLVTLPGAKITYVFDTAYRSLVGRHTIRAVFKKTGDGWQQEGFWCVLMALVRELYSHQQWVDEWVSKRKQLELTYRLTDSLQNMCRFIQHWQQAQTPPDTFIRAEQGVVFGHWMHPTPKSRQGCLDWQHALFSPELQGRFQLHLFAIPRELMIQDSDCEQSAEAIIRSVFNTGAHCAPHETLVPVHPLQAHWLAFQTDIKPLMDRGIIRDLGAMGPYFLATSSMRTVYNPELDWMFKLSIPVKLTNSLRQNKAHELDAGVLMCRLLNKLDVGGHNSSFRVITDPAYITARIDGRKESGLECIIRSNPFKQESAANVAPLACLLQDSLHKNLPASLLAATVAGLADATGLSPSEAALSWFNRYWDCAIEPCIRLFDRYGIALEAHQQNILIELHESLPRTCFYRDNQGYYLCNSQKKFLLNLLPALAAADDLFYDTDMVIKRFGYYLVVNQLFSVIHRFGCDGLISEAQLVRVVINRLRSLMPALGDLGGEFVRYLLFSPSLASKANLLTRVKDIDELEADMEMAVYVPLANPIAAAIGSAASAREREYA